MANQCRPVSSSQTQSNKQQTSVWDGWLPWQSVMCTCVRVSVYMSVCFSFRNMHLNATLSEWKDGWQVWCYWMCFLVGRQARIKRACSVLSWNELLVNIYREEVKTAMVKKPKTWQPEKRWKVKFPLTWKILLIPGARLSAWILHWNGLGELSTKISGFWCTDRDWMGRRCSTT